MTEEVRRRLQLHGQRELGPPQARQQLPGGLDTALRPSSLLELQRAELGRKLRRDLHVVPIHEPPPAQLCPVAQVQVLGERVRLPASRFLHTAATPHACRPVEVEEEARAVAGPVLDGEVGVQKERLRTGEPAPPGVQVAPGGLHRAHGGIRERRDQPQQQVRRRYEIGVQDQEEVAPGQVGAGRQRPRLEARPVGPPDMTHINAPCAPAGGPRGGQRRGLVGGIVQDLDLQPAARPFQAAGGIHQALHHVRLVVDRELHRHRR